MERILFISPSTQDRRTWMLTIIIGILPLAFFGWKTFCHVSGFSHWAILFTIFLIIFIVGFVSTPYKYVLTNTHLIIKRYWRDIYIPLSEIKVIHLMPATEKKTVWKSFGYGGPFGFFGYFSSKKYTKLHTFARRYNNWTLIITSRKKYVIAPDDTQLVEAVMKQIGQKEVPQELETTKTYPWQTYVFAIIVIAVTTLLFLTYKEPTVVSDSTNFRLKGLWGMNILMAEIHSADTITWKDMPVFSIRTNGVSFIKVRRGRFRTSEGDKARLSLRCCSDPIIKIVDNNGITYYLNRKNPNETRQIFSTLQANIHHQ